MGRKPFFEIRDLNEGTSGSVNPELHQIKKVHRRWLPAQSLAVNTLNPDDISSWQLAVFSEEFMNIAVKHSAIDLGKKKVDRTTFIWAQHFASYIELHLSQIEVKVFHHFLRRHPHSRFTSFLPRVTLSGHLFYYIITAGKEVKLVGKQKR